MGQYSNTRVTGTVSKDLKFNSDRISIALNVSSGVGRDATTGGTPLYVRGGGKATACIGVSKPLSQNNYTTLNIVENDGVSSCNARTGSPNDANTDISTATIITSGSVPISLALPASDSIYIVVGKIIEAGYLGSYGSGVKAGEPGWNSNPGNLNLSFNTDIFEIYLV